ncbi:alpha-tocopherol transfer protein-like [Branchiostoma lanceolatum]|uniref:alpha-tocopherol transfer protein-like n=1 Tax=Branchiostoma lanceolatum TaxID=7740 RepID=UPI0034538ED4
MEQTASPPSGYVCNLSAEALKKAREELNEDPTTRLAMVEALRERIQQRPDLCVQDDDHILLRFLRARYFDVEQAFKLLEKYHVWRTHSPKICSNMRPSSVRGLLEAGYHAALPGRDQDGRKVMFYRIGKWDPSQFSAYEVFRLSLISSEKIIQEEDTQVHGIVMIADLTGLSLSHAWQIGPRVAQQIGSITTDAFPIRVKEIHLLNEPMVFNAIFAIIKPFMSEKMRNRIHLHGPKTETLLQYVDRDALPPEYGGTGTPLDEACSQWTETLLASEDEFSAMSYSNLEEVTEKNEVEEDDEVEEASEVEEC